MSRSVSFLRSIEILLIDREMDIADTIACFRYYAGLADKLHGQSNNHFGTDKLVYTLHQPIGVCGQM
jgi:aldehyde dehydrogenase (NAD+)